MTLFVPGSDSNQPADTMMSLVKYATFALGYRHVFKCKFKENYPNYTQPISYAQRM